MAEDTDSSAQHTSLFVFKENNPLRRQCKAIVNWTPFEYIILVIIILNCIILGFVLYLPEDNATGQTLEKAELYFLLTFIAEMILKVVAFGFAFHPGSYLRSPWNLIDFFVIVIGVISLFPLNLDLTVLRLLRIFRLLRLLRFIKLFKNKE